MNIIEMREGLRRTSTAQHQVDRRKVPYEFGSPEWLEYIKNNNVDCPKFNRRQAERRTHKTDRRQQYDAVPIRSKEKYKRVLLTPAEKKLIEDLYFSDME